MHLREIDPIYHKKKEMFLKALEGKVALRVKERHRQYVECFIEDLMGEHPWVTQVQIIFYKELKN